MKPFIRSAGGKRALASRILDMLPEPEAYHSYVEPFLGGGSIYFALQAAGALEGKRVVLGDVSTPLMELYAATRDKPGMLRRQVNQLIAEAQHAGVEYYFEQRARWNGDPRHRTPARHLYLRRACFNGLWRENKQGHMNTPWRGEPAKPYNTELHEAGLALRRSRVELLGRDFRHHVPFVERGTLVYLDPPYLDGAAFTAYHASGWSAVDHLDLIHLCRMWTARGAYVILSHADTPEMRETVATWWPTATVNTVMMRRAINRDGAKRGPVPELLVTA